MGFDTPALQTLMQGAPPAGRWLVAFSGGLDSHVLLHALARIAAGRELLALHVNHGLLAEAPAWEAHCEQVCRALGVPLHVLRVEARPEPGESPEAAAREARYTALAGQLRHGDLLLTAHHLDDQAETVLLQLMRGAGPAGLAAMPAWTPFATGWLGRPLLGFERRDLEAYATAEGLAWVEDPSNRELAYDRNFLRHRVLPLLTERWPAATRMLARVADQQADALEQLDTLGREDAQACQGDDPDTLDVACLRRLRRGRRRNLLRLWLLDKGLTLPPRGRMEEMLGPVLEAGEDRVPEVRWADCVLRRYRGQLHAERERPFALPSAPIPWDPRTPLVIPGLGLELAADSPALQGLDLACLHGPLTVRFRGGGERIRLPGRAHSSSVKTLMQEAGIPPWQRAQIPLVYAGETLVAVWGFWVCDPAGLASPE